MEFFDSLWNSVRLPKKEAMFRLNRKGITSTIMYLFILMTVLFLPDMVGTIIRLDSNLTEVSRGLYLVQVFVFYPMLIIFLILVGVSALAGAALIMTNQLDRKLTYQQLWKMTAYAATVPLVLSILLKNTPVPNGLSALIFFSLFIYIMFRMIIIYPKKKAKR
ncbi:hypothetical protein CEH05_01210 [Halobacillus halophilus]|uniref:DUF1189 domain-containing protein n=1 Tax=Halobacillus halophilus (strain ATCC 35676 / DSM 2266 / JCM 20832 / KCTC 3685 / LMG 17431 / NBRC 102448 / NCIMB 2269) TaxID=866895 RepID=I0JHG9_HALH3|nr:DUF1189 family protein [Halobacillus halophilus]ASF37809.1 hypothetical protein CEH05_01210 [Halobacillus halophilus]CCG43587.1 hypothetical protein HBHAL_1208 [Halobacillus halophilus DSM 2266]